MVSEENLEHLRACGASYLVGTPKSMLRQFERELLETDGERVEADDVRIDEVSDPAHQSGKRLTVEVAPREDRREWFEQADGCYLLRTNLEGAASPKPTTRQRFGRPISA